MACSVVVFDVHYVHGWHTFAVIHDGSLVKHLEVRQDVVEVGINDSAEPGPINFRDVFEQFSVTLKEHCRWHVRRWISIRRLAHVEKGTQVRLVNHREGVDAFIKTLSQVPQC